MPDAAVCNEAVKLAKKRKFQGLSGFVNGVLRTLSREKGKLEFTDPSVRFSIPGWMLSMWEADYGKEKAEQIAASFLKERPLTVRFNTSRASVEEILKSLESQGIAAEPTGFLDTVYSISGYDHLEAVEAFYEGLMTVQDPSSALAAHLAGIKAGDTALDICSAPGGKTLHAADLLKGTGRVEARDLTEYKISLVEQNLFRCGFANVETKVWDARIFDPEMEEKADVVRGRPALFRPWDHRKKAGYQAASEKGGSGGAGISPAGDPFGGQPVCEARRYSFIQHLHGEPGGK